VELFLKDIILVSRRIENILRVQHSDTTLPGTHNLQRLLDIAECAIAKIEDEIGLDEEPFDTKMKEILRQLIAVDNKSVAFRYPVDLGGKPFFKQNQLAGYGPIKKSMDHVYGRFTGVTDILYRSKDIAEDMLSEMDDPP
jgi:hypothetical protein